MEEVAQVAGECILALQRLKWDATPWLHTLYYHTPQFVEHWGSLWQFGCWGLEGRHRRFKQDYHLSVKKSTHPGSHLTGIASCLGRTSVALALKRVRVRALKKRVKRHPKALTEASVQRALQLIGRPV